MRAGLLLLSERPQSQIDPPNLNPNPLSFPSTIFFRRRRRPKETVAVIVLLLLRPSTSPFHPSFVYIEGFHNLILSSKENEETELCLNQF